MNGNLCPPPNNFVTYCESHLELRHQSLLGSCYNGGEIDLLRSYPCIYIPSRSSLEDPSSNTTRLIDLSDPSSSIYSSLLAIARDLARRTKERALYAAKILAVPLFPAWVEANGGLEGVLGSGGQEGSSTSFRSQDASSQNTNASPLNGLNPSNNNRNRNVDPTNDASTSTSSTSTSTSTSSTSTSTSTSSTSTNIPKAALSNPIPFRPMSWHPRRPWLAVALADGYVHILDMGVALSSPREGPFRPFYPISDPKRRGGGVDEKTENGANAPPIQLPMGVSNPPVIATLRFRSVGIQKSEIYALAWNPSVGAQLAAGTTGGVVVWSLKPEHPRSNNMTGSSNIIIESNDSTPAAMMSTFTCASTIYLRNGGSSPVHRGLGGLLSNTRSEDVDFSNAASAAGDAASVGGDKAGNDWREGGSLDGVDLDPVHQLAWSPDGQVLAGASKNRSGVAVWDLCTGDVTRIGSRFSRISQIQWSPCGSYLAAVLYGKNAPLQVFETQTWRSARWGSGALKGCAWVPLAASVSLGLVGVSSGGLGGSMGGDGVVVAGHDDKMTAAAPVLIAWGHGGVLEEGRRHQLLALHMMSSAPDLRAQLLPIEFPGDPSQLPEIQGVKFDTRGQRLLISFAAGSGGNVLDHDSNNSNNNNDDDDDDSANDVNETSHFGNCIGIYSVLTRPFFRIQACIGFARPPGSGAHRWVATGMEVAPIGCGLYGGNRPYDTAVPSTVVTVRLEGGVNVERGRSALPGGEEDKGERKDHSGTLLYNLPLYYGRALGSI